MVFFPKTHQLGLIREKHQTQIWRYSTGHWGNTPKDCPGYEKQKLSQTRGDWVNLSTKCSVVSWNGPWNRKRTSVEKLVKPRA